MSGFGAPELIILFLSFAPVIVVVWALVDAAVTNDFAWQRAGQNKTLWIVLLAVGILFCWLGLVLAIVYFAAIRPQVRRAMS